MKVFALTLSLVLLAAPVYAQNSTEDLREQLANEKDIAALRRRDFDLARKSATQPEALIERGMVLMRLFQLSRDEHDIKQAKSVFERATKKLPNDARAFYGEGLARLGGPGVRVPSPLGVLNGIVVAQSMAEIVKRDPVSLAKQDFKKAIELDPTFVSPAVELAHVSVDTHDKSNMEIAAVALRRLVKEKRGGSGAATALSEVESALGHVEAAATAAETATGIAVGSNDASAVASASLARAVALLRQPGKEDDGARVYTEGLAKLTDESAKAYYAGIAPIVTERERNEWESASLEAKQDWLKRFWSVRAASSGVTLGERLAEHYKRLASAQDKYRHQSARGAAPGGSLIAPTHHAGDLPFDDRGLIYVRHGAPYEIVRTSDVDLRPNETWIYRGQNGQNILYHFVVLRDGTDYRIVDDVLVALDPSTRGVPTEAAAKLLRDRQAYEPRYAALAQKYDSYDHAQRTAGFMADAGGSAGDRMNESSQSINTAQTRIAADMRAQALIALTTDSDAPDFKSDMPFYYDLYAFKGKNGMTDVTAAAALPGTSLFSRRMGGQYIYSLQASLIFIDTTTNEIFRRDTTYNFWSTRVLGEQEHLRLTVNMSVKSAKAAIHRIVLRDLADPGVGQLYGGPSELKNFSSPSLMISDIVLAESEDGVWQRGLAHLGLVPPRQFEEKKPLKVFYELYNLPLDTPYRTEIAMIPVEGVTGFGRLKKLLGGKDGAIHLQFDGVSQPDADNVVQELRQVSAEVKPGKYRIEVRVTNLANQQAVRTETMFIVGKR